jgi:NhaP-type Na+/H+ or K+/H+ antiporter
MPPILIIGIVLFTGFICGEIATKIKLPKVTGYIIAGVLLNPGLFKLVPADFADNTDVVTNIALSFITFSVGGTLLYHHIRKLGKGILYITFFEAEFAFLAVAIGIVLVAPFFVRGVDTSWLTTYIPLGLLMACLASPTDPSATLAVAHEYRARGPVTSTIMGVAAFDDVTGIINYSIAVAIAQVMVAHGNLSVNSSLLKPAVEISGGVLLGIVLGFTFNIITRLIKKETEGVLIVLVFAFLSFCFGLATLLGFDELLCSMTMGMVVVNFNAKKEKIFRILERYTEQLIFVLFFTLSGMHLNFSVLHKYFPFILLFVLFRSAGKVTGAIAGAYLAGSPKKVKKYTAAGLIPQGGIVVGLALLIRQNPAFAAISDIMISVIIGAAIFHELIGPVLAEWTLKKAGEISPRLD